jgi:superfamily II DNA or RNA helicase
MVGLAASAEAEKLGGKVQVIVPTIDLLHQWTAQVRQHLPGIRVGQLGDGQYATLPSCDVLISVVNSAQDYEPRLVPTNSLLIADECHRLGSEGNARSLNEGFSARLGLSATYARSDDGNFDYLDPYFTGTCFHMDYARAITDEVTAHFKVALVAVRFVGGEHYAYDEANNKAQKARRRLIEQGLVHAEPFGEFMKDVSALAAGGEGPATWTARSYLNAFAERRRILADTPAKKTKLGDLAASVRSANRSIVFTQTIEAAEDAADILRARGLSAEAIHSGLEQAKRRQTLGLFAEGGLKAIAAPQVLDEGVDVPAADLAIIVAASRTRRQMIQRMGRVLRRKPDGRLARFAILYVEATSEDPAQGAHGDFLDEVTSVADEVRSFSVGAEASDVSAFLNDCWTGKPQPLPRMASSSTGRRLDTSLPVVDGSKAIQTPSKPKAVARVMPKVTAAKQTSPKSMSFQDASVAAIGIEVTRTPGLPRRGWEAVGLSDLTCSECPGRLGVIRNRTSGNIALLCAHDKCAWSVVDYDEGTIALVREYIRVVDDTRGGGLPGGRP